MNQSGHQTPNPTQAVGGPNFKSMTNKWPHAPSTAQRSDRNATEQCHWLKNLVVNSGRSGPARRGLWARQGKVLLPGRLRMCPARVLCERIDLIDHGSLDNGGKRLKGSVRGSQAHDDDRAVAHGKQCLEVLSWVPGPSTAPRLCPHCSVQPRPLTLCSADWPACGTYAVR